MRKRFERAALDLGTDAAFSRLDTDVGSFLVSIQDVEAFADGSRLGLRIGNLTSATVAGCTLIARYGTRKPSSDTPDKPRADLQEKRSIVTRNLHPGTWNTVALTLPGIVPADLGHLELKMQANRILLAREDG